MLDLLHIENIAIIERADIAFQPGFNALTGETGAGKSIVIDAMSAVLGQRASRDLIRTGADKAFVSATFSGVEPALFGEFGLEPDEELLLLREIHADGKNTCRVNGRPFTVTQLRALGSRLLNIHGQHDGQQLLDEEQHQLYLDSFGKTEELLNTYTEKYQAFTEIHRQIRALQMDESEKARRVVDAIKSNCQGSNTSVMYCGGTGGSARGGVCHHPIAITEAVHAGKAHLTIGGAPAYVYPGGGINFIVDTAKVVNHAFTWVPTPATVAPVEYTMTKEDYAMIGGHMNCIKNVEDFPEYQKH